MEFASKAWRILVAIKDGLVLLFMLLFFLVLFSVLSSRSGAVKPVTEGALLLKLNGAVVEEPAEIDPVSVLLSQQVPMKQFAARDIVTGLRGAAKDDRIKAVVLDLSRFVGGGQVHLQEIGQALDGVRAAKKPVLVFADLYGDDSLLLAAHASESWIDPMGAAIIQGPGGKNLYFGRLLEKLKIDARIFRVGTFKSAVEPYIRNDQSPEAREASAALYGALWENWKADVSKVRPKANIALAAGDPEGWIKASNGDTAKAALAAGLVDKIGDQVDFGKRVAEIVGEDVRDERPGKFANTSLNTWTAANPAEKPGKPIAVVTIAGVIMDGNQGPGTASGDRIAKLLDKELAKEPAALVVRVDSPGGSVTASEKIRTAIERYKAKKIPVVVSMANLAASGGYWVATPGTRLFAEPSTITGSIGIFAVVPSFERLAADWGVSTDGVQTTPLSGEPDLIGGMSPAFTSVLQSNIEQRYADFLNLVGKARGKTAAEVDAMAQGRVWDGGTARQKGLVDEFGGLDEALAYAAKAAKLEPDGWHAAYLGEPAGGFGGRLKKLFGDDEDEATDSPMGAGPGSDAHDLAGLFAAQQRMEIGRALASADMLLTRPGVRAYCLECPVASAAVAQRDNGIGLLARLGRLMGLL
jgi:protease IV